MNVECHDVCNVSDKRTIAKEHVIWMMCLGTCGSMTVYINAEMPIKKRVI